MICTIKSGSFQFFESPSQAKILVLDRKRPYAWIRSSQGGDILVYSSYRMDSCTLSSSGRYRLYMVTSEAKLSDQVHLELLIGKGRWQGYLLPTGFPTKRGEKREL